MKEQIFRRDNKTKRFVPIGGPRIGTTLTIRKERVWPDGVVGQNSVDIMWSNELSSDLQLRGAVWQGWDWVGSVHQLSRDLVEGHLGSSDRGSLCYSPQRKNFVGAEIVVLRALEEDVLTY